MLRLSFRYVLVFIILIHHIGQIQAQHDSVWATGQFGNLVIFKNSGEVLSPNSTISGSAFYTVLSLSSLSYSKDSVIFMSNGVRITNNYRKDVVGFENLVDNVMKQERPSGFSSRNSTFLLPRDSTSFYTINRSGDGSLRDDFGSLGGNNTYYGIIKLEDSAKSRVIQSKIPLKENTQLVAHQFLTATRHANGRDFWVVEKAWQGNKYYIYRTSPDTIVLDHVQEIGDSTGDDAYGGGCFSPRGDKLVITTRTQYPQIFDFDRCTGWLSNTLKIKTPALDREGNLIPPSVQEVVGGFYASFSPSGRYLYFNTLYRIDQYDLISNNADSILTSRYQIDTWDSSFLTQYQTREPFDMSLLGVDNKLYYSNFNPPWMHYLHVIHQPDSAREKCGYVRCGFKLGMKNSNGSPLPNVPYYSLKSMQNSPCDTIGKYVPPKPVLAFALYPNPATQEVTIEVPDTASVLFYDMMGRVVASYTALQKQQLYVGNLASGIYNVIVKYGGRKEKRKLILMR